METTPSNPNSQKQHLALRVALDTMKDRCILQQKRLTEQEEENQKLRERLTQQPISHKTTNAGGVAENFELRLQLNELQRQNSQLNALNGMVSAENRKLWSRLSQMAKDQSSKLKDGECTLTASDVDAVGGDGSPRGGLSNNQNLIRSKTFTQHSPNPNLRHLRPAESCESQDMRDVSLEEDVALEVYGDGECIRPSTNEEAMHQVAMGFGYLNVDDTSASSSSQEQDFNVEAKRCIDGLQEMRRQAMRQQKELNSVFALLESRIAPALSDGADWSYDNADLWGNDYPKCNGRAQSPIHIQTSTTYIAPLLPLQFSNYDIPLLGNITLSNNGHSVEFPVPVTVNGKSPSIKGGTLKSKYEAVGVHFHWGSNGFKGSEHIIDNRRFDVEMHIVHKNVKYATVAEATLHPDGLTVLGIMFKITRTIDRFYPGLNKIFDTLSNVQQYQSSTPLPGQMTLGQMLGDLNTKKYFTYIGSLTTPDCAEAVTWHVFPEPLPIAYEDIQKFWSILDSNNQPLLNNYRPVQPINSRPILYRIGFKPANFVRG